MGPAGRTHGESGSADMAAIPEHVRLLRTVAAQYHPQDVFNMDETAFYYMAVPRSSVCLMKPSALTQNKARLAAAVTVNADDTEKLSPNATAAIQPTDHGVITYAKQGVMGLKSDAALYRLLDGDSDPYNVRLVDAIHRLQSTWSSMPADAIKNYWEHSGLFVDRASIDCILNSD